jgi:transposase-like protein
MEGKRKVWTAKQKLEVVLEGLKEKETVAEVCPDMEERTRRRQRKTKG